MQENIMRKGKNAGYMYYSRQCFQKPILLTLPQNDKFYTRPNSVFEDNNFKCDENGGKFSNRVENTHHEQFLLSFSVFKRLVLQTHKNKALFGKGLRKGS